MAWELRSICCSCSISRICHCAPLHQLTNTTRVSDTQTRAPNAGQVSRCDRWYNSLPKYGLFTFYTRQTWVWGTLPPLPWFVRNGPRSYCLSAVQIARSSWASIYILFVNYLPCYLFRWFLQSVYQNDPSLQIKIHPAYPNDSLCPGSRTSWCLHDDDVV